MRSSYYHALRSEGLVNTDAPSLKEMIRFDTMFRLHCNNQFKCARGSHSKHGAIVIKNLLNPHKHTRCPVCGDSRIVVVPQKI